MKVLIFAILIALSFTSVEADNNHTFYCDEQAQGMELKNIQQAVSKAFMSCFIDRKTDKLDELVTELDNYHKKSKNQIFLYWKAYSLYYKSIYYLKDSDKDHAYTVLKEGIEILKSIDRKNSEDYALLSMLQNFSCQFITFPEIATVSKEAGQHIELAIELDPNNPRAYYVMASNDFYTPEQYGGGKLVEKHALRAISLPSQKTNNPYLPSWGKQESYEMLTNWYIKKGRLEAAAKYIKEGLKEFPDSYVLQTNQKRLDKN